MSANWTREAACEVPHLHLKLFKPLPLYVAEQIYSKIYPEYIEVLIYCSLSHAILKETLDLFQSAYAYFVVRLW